MQVQPKVGCDLELFRPVWMLNVLLQENIGIVFAQQGKLEEAEQMYNQTLQIRLKVFGDDSLDVADTQKNIADIQVRSAQAQ